MQRRDMTLAEELELVRKEAGSGLLFAAALLAGTMLVAVLAL